MGSHRVLSSLSSLTVFLLIVLIGVAKSQESVNKAKTLKSASSVNPSTTKSASDRKDEKLITASQSLFGYNNGIGGGGGGFPGSSGQYAGGFGGQGTSGFGGFGGSSSGIGSSGIFNGQVNSIDGGNRGGGIGGSSGGFSTLGPNGFSGQTGGFSQGFGQGGFSGFGQNSGQYYPGAGGFGNGLYQGGQGQGGFGGGYNPYNGIGGFNSYPQFGGGGGFPGSQGGFQGFQGGQTDRNLGFVNQAFGNPLYNRSPPLTSTSTQPGLGSFQVGNRVDVNSGNRGISYSPSGGPGGFTTSTGGQFGQGIYSGGFGQPYPGSGYNFGGFGGNSLYPGAQGGLYNNRQIQNFPIMDYLNRGVGLRGSASPVSGGPPRVGSGSSRDAPGSRLQGTGPNRFYQGANPSGSFGRERIHRFTADESIETK